MLYMHYKLCTGTLRGFFLLADGVLAAQLTTTLFAALEHAEHDPAVLQVDGCTDSCLYLFFKKDVNIHFVCVCVCGLEHAHNPALLMVDVCN